MSSEALRLTFPREHSLTHYLPPFQYLLKISQRPITAVGEEWETRRNEGRYIKEQDMVPVHKYNIEMNRGLREHREETKFAKVFRKDSYKR